jgi:hypothetical protein
MSTTIAVFRCPNPDCRKRIEKRIEKRPESSRQIPSEVTWVECNKSLGGCGWHGTPQEAEYVGCSDLESSPT